MTPHRRPPLHSLSLLLATLPACLAFAAPAPWQGALGAGSSGSTVHIHGTVVDGTTGKPIPRVLVSSLDRRLATMTNGDGAFVLDVTMDAAAARGLLDGTGGGNNGSGVRLYLEVRKPGYLEPQTRPNVGLNNAASPVTLKLMPAGIVEGHLSANGSVPPSKVSVSLLMHNTVSDDRIWVMVGGQQTDREGGFRFSNLRPGEYAVMSNEWRGDQPLPPSPSTVTEQYPPVFFGDSPTLAGATKLRLHYGETAEADLHLRKATYFPVTVPVGGANAGINVRVSTGEDQSGFRLGYNQADHAVEGSLPTGTYTLLISSYRPLQAYASVVLHVGEAPVRSAEVVPVAAAPILVRLHRDFTGKGTPPATVNARVYLQPQEQGLAFASATAQPGQEDEMALPDVAPGRYQVHVEPTYGYVAAVRSAGVDLRQTMLSVGVGGSAAPIDVTLRDDSGQISGTVQGGTAPLPEPTFVSLLPLEPGGQMRMGTAGPDGRFTLLNVDPGSYRLFASQLPQWGIPWHDPEALRALEGKGTEVTVTSNATLNVDAPLLDDGALGLP